MTDHGRYILDAAAVVVWSSAMLGYLPSVAATLSIVWLSIQISEWVYKKLNKNDK